MAYVRGNCPIRIYRPQRSLSHDLNPISTATDILGEDLWAEIRPTTGELLDLTPGGGQLRRLELWLDSRYDLDNGYLVEVKRPRTINGTRSAVEEIAATSLSEGATSITLPRTTGFRAGDHIVVSGGGSAEQAKVKAVAALTLTLYADCALTNAYDAGATVRASRVYQVVDQLQPEEVGPYRRAVLREVSFAAVVS